MTHDTETQRRAVEAARALVERDGLSCNAASAQVGTPLGVTGRTIKNWAVSLGLPLGDLARERTKNTAAASMANATYGLERRRMLLDKGFAKAEAMLTVIDEPRDLKDWVMSVAVLVDKRRLEDGDVTDRSEQVSSDPAAALERGAERVTWLRQQRKS